MDSNGINVLSLFDGMSSGRIALERLGIKVNQYFASEIDKHAITVSKANYPDIIHIGDVTKVKACDLPPIQLLLAGSPCQGFSFAGKQLAFDDPRSALFFEFVRIWNEVKEINPDAKFLLENVKMKKEHELVISRYMGVAPIEINAALVSAQNRVRLFWTNIANKPYGLFGDMECTIPQPKDKGILLRDILDTNVPEKYYLSEKMLSYFSNRAANFNQGKVNIRDEEGKASCLTSSMASCDISDNFIVASRGRNPVFENKSVNETIEKHRDELEHGTLIDSYNKTIHKDKSITITSRVTASNHTHIYESKEVLQINPSLESGGKQPYQQNRIYDPNGIAPALCAGKSDLLIISGTLRTHNDGKGFRPVKDEKAATIPARGREDGSGQNAVSINHRIRRLTPTECEKLQTVPVGYTAHVSDSQRYKMLGNGWCIDVIVHILSYLDLPCPTK
jgi:DNA (cytosine-5)-methyltransferase 3A